MASPLEEYRKLYGNQDKSKSPLQQFREQNQRAKAAQPSPLEAYRTSLGITPRAPSRLESSSDLYKMASSVGLKDRADEILAKQEGESPNKIFSGGFISDIFDSLSALQYGVTGVLKGKSFAEGVKTRQSFTDQDALGSKGIPGFIVGIALDIAVDPLTYIAPWTVLNKIPGVTKGLKAAKTAAFGKMATKTIDSVGDVSRTYQALEGGVDSAKYLADKFVWMFGKDPIFRETIERGTKNIAIATQNITDMAKGVANLDPKTAAKILKRTDDGQRWARKPLNELLQELSPKEAEPVVALYKTIDDLGSEAVDLGILGRETFEENFGTYLKNAYEEYEKGGVKLFPSSKTGIKNIFKRRVETLSEARKADQISNPAYLLFKSAFDLVKDVENAKILKQVSDNFGTTVAKEGFTQMPTGPRLGALGGKYIPEDMADYLKPIVIPDPDTLGKQLIGNFKFAKVVMNPATHARNVMSNVLLNWWKLGIGPWRADIYSEALQQASKGGKWVDEAKTAGYNLDTFASAEMKNILESPEAAAMGKQFGKAWAKTKQVLGDVYQKEENVAKLAAFIHQRKKGFGIEEAWKAAESATFNYAQVGPWVRKLRESIWGFPFITFAVKATPVAVETALKNPQRISAIGKLKRGIENQADQEELERERASEPPWVRDGFYIKLPIKDKHGRSAYFDLTYILPFGDMISGSLFERPLERETGIPVSPVEAALTKAPAFNFIREISGNKDFYGNKIWKDSDPPEKQTRDMFKHLVKTMAPPEIGNLIPSGYSEYGETQTRGPLGAGQASDENQKRTAMQEMLRMVGLKIQPVDADIQESLKEWNAKKALTQLLLENFDESGIREFQRLYSPKK